MKKIIHIIVIILIIAALCIVEQVLAQSYFNELDSKVDYIKDLIEEVEDIETSEISYYTNELYTYWTEKESVLCTFVNHKEIDDIGIEIDKLKTALSNGDKEKYEESLNLVKFFIESYQHIVGINVQNIF